LSRNLTSPQWQPLEQGNGRVNYLAGDITRLTIAPISQGYTNAQLDDYHGKSRSQFPWRPPVRLSLEARFLGEKLDGTAGFGFWNAPFGGGELGRGGRLPVLPAAAWFFFGGDSNNMAFAKDVSGWGWKAACIHAHHAAGYSLMAGAPMGFLLMRSRALYRRIWPMLERLLGISERELPVSLMSEWHQYSIEWGEGGILFRIDNEIVHKAHTRIGLSLGLVIWIDNQYLVATPAGKLRFGTIALTGAQHLEIREIGVERLTN
jgi:hypothetical protein